MMWKFYRVGIIAFCLCVICGCENREVTISSGQFGQLMDGMQRIGQLFWYLVTLSIVAALVIGVLGLFFGVGIGSKNREREDE